jgi:LacI family transcriptional regulator
MNGRANMRALTIGIYGDAADQMFQRSVAGVLRYCTEAGRFHVRDFRMRDIIEDLDRRPPPWAGHVDGAVVGIGVGRWPARAIADWVVLGGVPAVAVGHDWFDPRVPAFYIDPVAIAECAAEHLLACGCASLLYFGYAKSAGSAARGEAFGKAVGRLGRRAVAHASPTQFGGVFEDEAGVRADAALADLLRSLRRPVGVFALNDFFAAAVGILCRDLHLAVPDDVRILGSDDTFTARSHHPPLSSMHTPREEAGFAAMAALHRVLATSPAPAPPAGPTAIGGARVAPRVSTVGAREAVANLDDVRRHIEEHACGGVTVEQLVDLVGVSRRTFETWFRGRVGHSPGQEIQRVRLAKAKELLRGSELSVTRIAAMVGFREAAAFSKFFRNATGLSPRDFRHHRRRHTSSAGVA